MSDEVQSRPPRKLEGAAFDTARVIEDVVKSVEAMLSDGTRRSQGERTHLSELARRLTVQAVALRGELDAQEPDSKLVAAHVDTARMMFIRSPMVKAALALGGVAASGPVQFEATEAWKESLRPSVIEWVTDAAGQLERLSGTISGEAVKSEPLTRDVVYQIATDAVLKDEQVDLEHADLSGLTLKKINLSEADLSQANLSGADLSQANLSQADLSRANLAGADLFQADLTQADLSRADLSQANITHAILDRVNLTEADLTEVMWLPSRPPAWPNDFDPPENSWEEQQPQPGAC